MRRLIALLVIAGLLSLVLFVTLPNELVWQQALEDTGHGPVFAGIALALWYAFPETRYRGPAKYVLVFGTAVALGVGSEVAQAWLPNHDASVIDALHDAAGAALALALVAWASTRARWSVVIALAAVAVLAWEPLQCARAYGERHASLPVLAPAGSLADRTFLRARNAALTEEPLPSQWRTPEEGEATALRLSFRSGERPALELFEPSPDWRRYHVLAVDVTNPGDQPVSMILRVLDAGHDWSSGDRLNLPVILAPRTRSTIRVALSQVEAAPARRRMDLGSIRNVMLFANRPVAGETLFVSRVGLE